MSFTLLFVVHCLFVLAATYLVFVFFLMIRRPPRSTLDRSSAASDVYKRQAFGIARRIGAEVSDLGFGKRHRGDVVNARDHDRLSLIHISEPTRPY